MPLMHFVQYNANRYVNKQSLIMHYNMERVTLSWQDSYNNKAR